jgi:DNA-directed RNA polymerase sigma subunit (sigma70/sigma32)
MTLDEIGRKLRLTRERVRQIQKAALSKLQERFAKEGGDE